VGLVDVQVVHQVDDVVGDLVDADLLLVVLGHSYTAVVHGDDPVSLEQGHHALPEAVVGAYAPDEDDGFTLALFLVIELDARQFREHATAIPGLG
jgi:hypothetical protein